MTGTIFEPTANGPTPLAGVTVFVHQPGQWVKTTTTDVNGRYATSVNGSFVLQTNKVGFQQPCAATGALASGTSMTKNIELYSEARLSAGATPPASSSAVIAGTVSNANGPIAGASVNLVDANDMPLAYTITSSQGHYFVCRVPNYQYLYSFDDTSQSEIYDIGVATDRTVNLTQ